MYVGCSMNSNGMSDLKNKNFNIIIKLLRFNSEMTMTSIAEKTKYSIATVKKTIDYAVKANIITPADIVQSSNAGRKAQLYTLNKNYAYTLYFAIDNNELYFKMINFNGECCKNGKYNIKLPNFLNDIKSIFIHLQERYKRISLVCVSIPAIVKDGTVISWYYNPKFNNKNIQLELAGLLNVPCIIENDMKLSVLAKAENKSLLQDSSIATLQFGHNGIGLAIFANGKILRGENGFAGEIGFLPDVTKSVMSKRYCAKVVINLIVFTNPQTIVFYVSKMQNEIKKIMEIVSKSLPPFVIPHIVISNDYLNDVFSGMQKLSAKQREIDVTHEIL